MEEKKCIKCFYHEKCEFKRPKWLNNNRIYICGLESDTCKYSNKIKGTQFGIGINMVVETDISANEFTDKFIKWVESNGWLCCGSTYPIDENGNKIDQKRLIFE